MASKNWKKSEKQCHAFSKSILQIIAFITDAGFGMYKKMGKSWEVSIEEQFELARERYAPHVDV